MTQRKLELETLARDFLAAFNRNDLDAVMAFFAEGAVYDELSGVRSTGKEAIRAAFSAQFAGKFGRMEFVEDDTFVDADASKVMSSWDLKIYKDDSTLLLRGLDLLHFQDGKVILKETYVKAKSALYNAV